MGVFLPIPALLLAVFIIEPIGEKWYNKMRKQVNAVFGFTMTDYDKKVYAEELQEFLPDTIVDSHAHCWRVEDDPYDRSKFPKKWTNLVAGQCPAPDLIQTYKDLFPGKRVIQDGDIVSIDVGATYKGYVGDCAGTFPVGTVSSEALKLIRITRESFFEGIKYARHGERLFTITAAIQEYVESNGYSVVRDLVGHGIGKNLHEDPNVPNFGKKGRGVKLAAGMTLAIEPMVNAGEYDVCVLDDDWTVVTEDGSLSAHYENTILITKDGCEILTL